jgi:hypothetical protein
LEVGRFVPPEVRLVGGGARLSVVVPSPDESLPEPPLLEPALDAASLRSARSSFIVLRV